MDLTAERLGRGARRGPARARAVARGMIERWRERIANIASIGGPGAVARLGPTIIYHASEASRFMTGSVLVIDRGQLLK